MTFGSNFPYFAERILSVCTIQRTECTKLIPACIQFTPFLIISIFCFCFIPLFLSCYIAVLYTETTNIHCPVRYTAYCKIQSGSNLCFHIFPAGSYITTPCSCRITLQTGKSRTGKQEDTLIIVYTALTVIDCFSIHQCISIEIFCRRSQCCRTA